MDKRRKTVKLKPVKLAKNPDGECPYLFRWNVKEQRCVPQQLTRLKYDDATKTRFMPGDLKTILDDQFPGMYEREYENAVDPRYNERAKIVILPAVGKVKQTVKVREPVRPDARKTLRRKIVIRENSPIVVEADEDLNDDKRVQENQEQEPIIEKQDENLQQEVSQENQEPDEEKTEEPDEENQEQEQEQVEDKTKDDNIVEENLQQQSSQDNLQQESNQENLVEEVNLEPEQENLGDFYDDPEYDFLYPHLDDPNFNTKIAERKEFNDTQYDGTIRDIKAQADKLCDGEFELMPHQQFVKNFMSFQTPYNSLLLYHGLGTGKTCSAIGIAEDTRNYMKQLGYKKSILIIASPNVQDNFRLQLFDERKLKFDNGIWDIQSCVGNSLLKEINPTDVKGTLDDRERIVAQIKSLIRNYYVFMGYTTFANYISSIVEIKGSIDYSDEERRRIVRNRIKTAFDNRLVIIDEVHNIRITKENNNRKAAELLMEVARNSDSLRLLLLSATPMYNSYEEIVWLTNLMNLNDKRATIRISEIFEKSGEFTSEGAQLLRQRLTGYVSYVRSENPYTFPYRIYPDKDASFVYPSKQMNGKAIEQGLKHVPVYLNGIGSYQSAGYKLIIENLKKNADETVFEDKNSFGYAMLQRPLEALDIIYPCADFDPTAEYSVDEENRLISEMIGKTGMGNIMRFKTAKNDKQYNFEYKTDAYGRIFSPLELPKYSAKIAKIMSMIQGSEGIVLIYTQYIDGGAVPIALALEEVGFSRYGSDKNAKSLFKTPPIAPTGQKYVMITGDVSYSPNNDEDLKYLNRDENKNGDLVKVVIITRAAGEGVDFKNIRQVHIMEPWYNMNRLEQIIGRAVRNLSHCRLPFNKRNVEIFLHATRLETDEESADLYVYRLAENKAVEIGRVSRLLKENAVDCLLNIGQTNFTTEEVARVLENQNIRLRLSSGREIDYLIGDRPFTDICDYMDNCAFKCFAKEPSGEPRRDTYSREFVESSNGRIMYRIRELFKYRHFYTREELVELINEVRVYPIEQIYSALTQFIDNKNEYITDMYGRIGNLVNHADDYLFQPVEITDVAASVYERVVPVDVKLRSVGIDTKSGEQPVVAKELSLDEVKARIQADFAEAFGPTETNSWFGTVSFLRPHLLSNHGITEPVLKRIVIGHILDTLHKSDKIQLLATLCGDGQCQVGSKSEVDTLIQEYLNARIVVAADGTMGIVIGQDSLETRVYVFSSDKWIEAPFVEKNAILSSADYQRKYRVALDSLSDLIGFISWFDSTRTREYVFKTRILNDSQVNKVGARVIQAQSKDIIKNLNTVLGEPKYNIKNIKTYDLETKLKLAVLFEIVVRHMSNNRKDGKVWFLNNEQMIENQVSGYSR